ncbi:hypothetical protein [Hyphomicrobium sp.]|uniref:hypothetical protein n=1 Tax=Hyphomicrobium sp. TaxID=82 RepID=UPI0035643CAD
MDALEATRFIHLRVGKMEKKEREPSYMRASKRFAALIEEYQAALNDFYRDAKEPVLVLKDRRPEGRDGRGRALQAQRVDYCDTDETDRMSAELRDINAWLSSADIKYLSNEVRLDCTNNRSLRRIFNNNSFEQGGRLFGGFWQQTTMRLANAVGGKPWRGHIRIEGEPVVVIDFSSVLLRLLYVEAGVQPPAGDLYLGFDNLGSEHRDAIKQVVSAMLFRTSPLSKLPRGTAVLLPKGWGAKRIEKAILKRHALVADTFYAALDRHSTPLGHRLFYRESEILLAALRQCQAEGVVALPVHDAIIVKESNAERASRIMLDAFKAATGFEGQVGEPKRPGEPAALPDTVFDDSGELPSEKDKSVRWLERNYPREDVVRAVLGDAQASGDGSYPPIGTDDHDIW